MRPHEETTDIEAAALPYKAKRQYLLTLRVSRYCFLALHSRTASQLQQGQQHTVSRSLTSHSDASTQLITQDARANLVYCWSSARRWWVAIDQGWLHVLFSEKDLLKSQGILLGAMSFTVLYMIRAYNCRPTIQKSFLSHQ